MKITHEWNQTDSDYVRKKLIEYNLTKIPEEVKHAVKDVSAILRNDEGEIVGGITGKINWYCLHIDFLWIDESLRGKGYGKVLINNIEETAIENNCHVIQLDTFSFQAPKFYQSCGYEIVGVVENHPTETMNQVYFSKKLI
ncbi:MAG: GNAT family N-acetyltransferase [Melioribacteraceae bacterium]|nr:GNAT family N-acetyltransferase [Melioribacteraceae bacterium]